MYQFKMCFIHFHWIIVFRVVFISYYLLSTFICHSFIENLYHHRSVYLYIMCIFHLAPRHSPIARGPLAHLRNAAVIWLKYCWYGIKHYPINQSITSETFSNNKQAGTNYKLRFILAGCLKLLLSPTEKGCGLLFK